MKHALVILLLAFATNITFAQNKEDAEKLVVEGIKYHDNGNFDAAVAKYDEALALDKDNFFALLEKALTSFSLQKFDDVINCCQRAIAAHPDNKELGSIYVSYGNALDGQKKLEQALAIYDEGIKKFPGYYQLYFNKGVALAGAEQYNDAVLCFQKAVMVNPDHASSHNAIARLSHADNKRIPALLAYCRFFTVEPVGARAKENLKGMQLIMKGNVEKTGKNSVTINISSDMLGDTAGAVKKENNFNSTDLLLSMAAALDYDKKNKKKSDVEQFIRKFESVCASLSETKKDNSGFFWEYYAPYFIEMKEKKHIETFAYIAFASADDPATGKWIKSHEDEIDQFLKWSGTFSWKKN